MCGIAGILKFQPAEGVNPRLLRRMCAAMVHRGPDDEGLHCQGPVGLAMRRLSIIDVANGSQPISNEDGSMWIVFNGEIYNHAALRERLISQGHRFMTCCDTETIIHLYEEYGSGCVQHLSGMFAFAIWDNSRKRLFVARDRLGIKPLYYHLSADSFAFGSEIKVLFAAPGVSARLNRSGLPGYLCFGYLSGSDTLYQGIRKLMPGHWLEVDAKGELRVEEYWDVVSGGVSEPREEGYYVGTYRELLEASVNSHLMSDVPVGVFLSGGLDSSAIAALMTRIRREPIETFSVGYSELRYSELPYARLVAEYLHSHHHEVHVSQQEFFEALPRLIWHEDEPLAWPSSVALYFAARLAREHVTVVLTGEGSDETLAGYGRYAFTLKNTSLDRVYRRLTPAALRRFVRGFIGESRWIGPDTRRKLGHSFLAKDGASWRSIYFDSFFSAFSGEDQEDLLTDNVLGEHCDAYEHVLSFWERSDGEILRRLLYTDIKTYLVELLRKQDSMSMAASIESRVPFLDHKLVEFALEVPAQHQIKKSEGKNILKKAVQGLLPPSVLERKKLGFPTPWSQWIEGPRLASIESFLLEPRTRDRKLLKPTAVKRLFEEHRGRHRDHSDRIWRLLNLEIWQRVCLEGESLANEREPARKFA